MLNWIKENSWMLKQTFYFVLIMLFSFLIAWIIFEPRHSELIQEPVKDAAATTNNMGWLPDGTEAYPYVPPNYIQNPKLNIDYTLANNKFCIPADYTEVGIGASMQPTLFDGAVVAYKKFAGDKEALKEGMIIEFEDADGKRVTHRIVGIYDDYLWLQGDRAPFGEKIEYEQIKGIAQCGCYGG